MGSVQGSTPSQPTRGVWARPWDAIVSPEFTRALERLSSLRHLRDGAFLYQQGDEGADLYGVQTGMVRISSLDRKGGEWLMGVYGPGTWFGEVPFLDGLPRPASAYAVGECEILVTSSEDVSALLRDNPAWNCDLARVVSHKLRNALARGQSVNLSIPARVALGLLDLAEACGDPGAAGVTITMKLSQEDFARVLGLSRQAVNRGLGVLKKREWIETTPDGFILTDMPALQSICLL